MMVKKTVTYTDFDGNERTEDHYFNLTKAELMKMQASVEGGLDEKLRDIMARKDVGDVMEFFSNVLKESYGVKSPDGRKFIKSEEIFKDFESTEAYSEIFMDICSNAKTAEEFFNGIIPSDLRVKTPQLLENNE